MTEKIIMIASSKGGVGKSTASLGIAYAMCQRGRKVLIVDLDFANACLDILTGVQDFALCTLQDVALGRADVNRALIKIPAKGQKKAFGKRAADSPGELWLLPSAVGGEEYLSPVSVCDSISSAAKAVGADWVILDTGAGINDSASVGAMIADSALVVTGQMPVAVRAAQSTADRLQTLGIRDIRLLINSFDAKGVTGVAHRRGLFTVIDESRLPLAGVIPYDYGLMLSHEGLSGAGEIAERAFDNIASRMEGNNVPIFTGMKQLRRLKKKICL